MAESCGTWVRKGLSVFFEYDTPKVVHIRSKKVGVTSRLVQGCILAYIVGYAIIYEKGYQQFDSVMSAVTTKVKGIAYTNFTDEELVGVPQEAKHLYRRIWDEADYVVPPQQTNAFFVTTNVIITPNQSLGRCAEDPHIPGWRECNAADPEATCPAGQTLPLGHGVNTGRCATARDDRRSCEILGWCPVELNTQPLGRQRAVLDAAKGFTVLIKNQIEFPLYGRRRSNILESSNRSYLASCLYDEDTDPFCPVFKLDTIARLAGVNFSRVAVDGSIISVRIQWDCDLDHDFWTHCRPEYHFRRLDNADAKIAPGWNFRYAHYFSDQTRTLYKAYGLLFVVDVQGRAGKFSLIPLCLNLGAGLALLSIATVICDIIVLHCMRDRRVYRDKKYLLVTGSDAFQVRRRGGYEGLAAGDEEDCSSDTGEAAGDSHVRGPPE